MSASVHEEGRGAPCTTADDPFQPRRRLVAERFDSGFTVAHDTYNGIGAASDGRIYYVLCSPLPDVGGRVYAFDPVRERIDLLGDLNAVCGEDRAGAVAQGKSHVPFLECGGRLFFATHVGWYAQVDGRERLGAPPGLRPYPGGHLLALDITGGRFEDLGIPVAGEGVLALAMETTRGLLYGLSWPRGIFFEFELPTRRARQLGPVSGGGEAGDGADYRTICRAIAVDPRDGCAYFTTADGAILRHRPGARSPPAPIAGDDLRKDYFGQYDPASPGHMGYHWRQTVWRAADGRIYAVHGNSGYLFRFDPRRERVEVLDRITSEVSRRSGMFDQFSYGYLGFALGPDGDTLHYLTGGPIYQNGRRLKGVDRIAMGAARGLENLHVITYHIPTERCRDHGAVFYPDGSRPTYVNSIAIARDGDIYTLARGPSGSATRTDLIRIRGPFD
ncbi:MAG: hypothetical protein N2652_09535 [Kiritimatiellae bacterium]|nr:hypothetical protein [Kiritimatiellia bacterium]